MPEPLVNPLDHAIHAAWVKASGGFSPISLARAWADWAVHMAISPGRRLELAGLAAAEASRALTDAATHATQGAANDKRFRDPLWRQWPFALWAEAFVAQERWWDAATQGLHGADPHSLALVNFLGKQALDAAAPTNFLPTNPVALARTRAERGGNLARGAAQWRRDAERALNGARPEAALAYVPGKTVALSEGVVVLRTRLAEILQFSPTSDRVRPEPVVIVPAWIMKYYILDLTPQSSMIRALTDAGFTVFAISWRNPTAEDRNLNFDDYGADGVMAALCVALSITGADQAHLVGYCIGGALAAVRAAAMARDHDARLKSLSLLAAQIDYTEAGDLRLFIDSSQVAAIEDLMWEEGVLEGSRMGGTFNLLRANDLIWSRLVHGYLMGEAEPINEMSAWSSDTTRMPYVMHRDYLRDFYLNNDFAEGRYRVDGLAVSPHDIRIPVFALGTETDNVAPWRSVFKIHEFADAETTFALTNGGHNQGVVCPPGTPHRHYRLGLTRQGDPRPDPQAWLDSHKPREGSWWPAWFEWLQARSGAPIAPPPLGPALEAAPGAYVFG